MNGIIQRSTFTNVNDFLVTTNNNETKMGLILKEIEARQTFMPHLPIKMVTGNRDGDRFVDVGTFEEPYVRNKASNKMAPDGLRLDATYKTYSRFDFMTMRGGESKVYKYEARLHKNEIATYRTQKMLRRVMETAIDLEYDMLYDDASKNSLDCSGLYARFNTITDRNGIIKSGSNANKLSRTITIDAGGTGEDLTSIFIMVPDTTLGVCRLMPMDGTDYSTAVKVQMGKSNLDEEWNREIATIDGKTGTFEYTIDQFDVAAGISVLSRGGCIRIANIDWQDTSSTNILKVRNAYRRAISAIDQRLASKPYLAVMNPETRIALADFTDSIILANQTTQPGVNAVPLANGVNMPKVTIVECDKITVAEDQVA